jgi:geranylgeranyl diphosphate synthase type I
MLLPDCFLRYQDELQAELKAAVGAKPLPLYGMMRYHLGWVDGEGENQVGSGKMSRPTLCLLACEAVGGEWHSALPAAAAVELVHDFSLIHDDIQDGSWERRGRPTVWKVWGTAQGINAGDAMYATAQLALLRLGERDVPWEKILMLSKRLNQACVQLCEGQYLDIAYEDHLDVTTDQYLDMIGKKTACLFETSLCFGALLGTDDEAKVAAITSFGRNLGMAFQVHNDLDGIWGEGETSKRSPHTDIRNKKKTLPIIRALQKADEGERERLATIFGKARVSDKDAGQVLSVLDTTRARSYAEGIREQYHIRALKDLFRAEIPDPSQQELREMAAFLLGGDSPAS